MNETFFEGPYGKGFHVSNISSTQLKEIETKYIKTHVLGMRIDCSWWFYEI